MLRFVLFALSLALPVAAESVSVHVLGGSEICALTKCRPDGIPVSAFVQTKAEVARLVVEVGGKQHSFWGAGDVVFTLPAKYRNQVKLISLSIYRDAEFPVLIRTITEPEWFKEYLF
jgi:hypothetical protein